jgi:hypothetical protein
MSTRLSKTLFMVMIDLDSSAIEVEFNDWYNDEHVPELLRVPGFLTGRRFRAIVGEPQYAAMYELASAAALNEPLFHQARPAHPKSTPATKKMWKYVQNLRRGIYQQIAQLDLAGGVEPGKSSHLLLLGFDFDHSKEARFRDWWTKDHMSKLVGDRQLVGSEYYILDATSTDHKDPPGNAIALYHLTSAESAQKPAWLADLPMPSCARILYERIYPV